jgi:hypothetical protein
MIFIDWNKLADFWEQRTASIYSDNLVNLYQITRRHIPEESNIQNI